MATRIRLGELLVRAGVLDELKLKAALSEQQKWGGRLGKVLVDLNFVSEELLVKALSKQLGIARATFENVNVPAPILAKVDPDFARTHAACPENYDPVKKVLTLAMADPTNMAAIDEIRFRTGLKIQATLAGELQIQAAIDRYLAPAAGVIELPDAIELNENDDRQVIAPNRAYVAAMAASGLAVEPIDAELPDAKPPYASNPPPQEPEVQAPATMPGRAGEVAGRLDGAQRQQAKAIRVMLELLIEKGVFSRDEYLALVNRR